VKAVRRWLACRLTRGNIGAYRDGEAPHLRERIEAHLQECARCRALADALAAQARAIEALPAQEEPPAGFVGRVMQRIEAAETRAPARSRPRAVRPAFAAALAASVVAAVVTWFVTARGPVRPGIGPVAVVASALAQAYRDSGRAYENEGQLEDALAAYTAARDKGGSHMARLDMARVYEKSGYTAEALGELERVAFAKPDDQRWEVLIVD